MWLKQKICCVRIERIEMKKVGEYEDSFKEKRLDSGHYHHMRRRTGKMCIRDRIRGRMLRMISR